MLDDLLPRNLYQTKVNFFGLPTSRELILAFSWAEFLRY